MRWMRSRVGITTLSIAVLAGTLTFGVSMPGQASDGYISVDDVHGPDDAGTQADLVSTAIDYGHLDEPNPTLYVQWTWDETSYTGNNTGDACALFDVTGEGDANYAVCVSIGGNPAAQLTTSPRVYECTANNLSPQRCNGDTPIVPFLSTCSVAIVGTDTVATCEIDMDDVGAGSATLINTCSFNSEEPNSNPVDCVLEPGMGVTVVKDVSDDAAVQTDFEVSIEATGVVSRSTLGDGSFFIPLIDGTHSVSEVGVPGGYLLDSATCTSGAPAAFTVTLGGSESVTCTFVNRPAVSSMNVTKTFSESTVDAGSLGRTFQIVVTNDGETALTNVVVGDLVDPTLVVTSVTSNLGGDCTATSGNDVQCVIGSIPLGQSATVTVTYRVPETVEPITISNTASVVSDEIAVPVSGSDSLTIQEDVDLTVSKSFTADPVAAGSTANSFVITATNEGISDSENVRITDLVDSTMTVTGVSISPSGDCSASSGQTVDCTVADLAGGASATVTVSYDVGESADPSTVTNTASVASDEITTPVTDSAAVGIIEDVVLTVTKAFASDPVAAGATNRTFSIVVTNDGASDAENVRVTDVVDSRLQVGAVTSATADCSATAGQSVDCAIATLGSGDSVTVVVTYSTDVSSAPDTITNTASATSDEVTSPSTGTDTVQVVEDVTLDIVKSFASTSIDAGSTGRTFSIQVTNTGISDAEGVRITDSVDPALTVRGVTSSLADCSASSGQNVDCGLAVLAPGQTVTVVVTFDVDETVEPVTVTNTGSVTSDEVVDPATSQAMVDITEDVVISASKVFSPSVAPAGSTGNTFVLTVSNGGVSEADNLSIVDVVDSDLTVTDVSISSGGDCSASAGQVIDCTLISLAAGDTATVTVTYSIDSAVTPGPVANSVTMTSDEDSTSTSSSVEVASDVGFLVAKSFDSASVVAGTTGRSFTISVTNSGPSDASAVRVLDSVDPDLTVTSATSARMDCSASSGQDIDCTIPTLSAGETVTVGVGYAVDETVDATTVTNTASVSANELTTPATATDSVDIVEEVSLSATKSFSNTSVVAGSTSHSFTLSVSNSGSSDADGLTIVDTVDPALVVRSVDSSGANCSASSGQNVECTVPHLGGGDTVSVVVTYDVDVSADASTITNTFSAASDEDATTGTDTIDVVEDVELVLDKSFADADVAAGTSGNSFELTLTNTGISDAENVAITDTVDSTLTVTSVTSSGADCSGSSNNDIDCRVSGLAPGASVAVTVFYDVPVSTEPMTIVNTASASADEDATTASASLTVSEDVTLGLSKTFSPSSAVAGGGSRTFTVVVTNSGISDAENVRVTDVVDPALVVTGVGMTPAADCGATAGNSIDCTIARLGPGATATLTVTYLVRSEIDSTTITNTAFAESDEVSPISAAGNLTITEQATLSASKTFGAASAIAGTGGHTFAIRITNTGVSTADNVHVTDPVDPRFTVTSVVATGSGDCSATAGNDVDCSFPSLASGETAEVLVTFEVPSSVDTSTISNIATIDSDETVTPLTPSDDLAVVEQVALDVDKTFSPDSVVAGTDGRTFSIVVTNTGASDAENVTVTDTVDADLVVTDVLAGPGVDCAGSSGNAISCVAVSLAASGTATITVTYLVPPDVPGGIIGNTASALSDETPSPVSGSDTVTVTEDVVLAPVKAFATGESIAGSTGNTFAIAVTNSGASTANDVSITDTVDPDLIVTGVTVAPSGSCSATVGNDVSCTIPAIGPNATATATVTYDVPEGADPRTVANTASVTSVEVVDPIVATDTIELVEDVDLVVTKTFGADPVTAGSTGNTFTIGVTNQGRSDAEGVTVNDLVDAAFVVTAVDPGPGGDCSAGSGNTVDCLFTVLAAGATATVTVSFDVVESADSGAITNTASVTSDETTTPITASDTVTVDEEVDLRVSKTFSTASATAGVSGYTFGIAVTNAGQSDADDVRITDVVDPDLTVTAVSVGGGGDCSASAGQLVDCTISTLSAGATATITVRFALDSGVSTPRTVGNTADAVSDEVTTPVSGSDTIELDAVVEFDSDKSFSPAVVAAGSTDNTFTIAISNSGPSDASGITVTDTVDPRLAVTGVSLAPSGDCSASVGQSIDCSIASMVVGEAAVVTVTYDVASSVDPGIVGNTASVDSVVPASTTAVSDSVAVVEDVDLVVSKSFAADPVSAGSSGHSFTLSVANTGLSDAENVSLVDTVDPALVVSGISASPGVDCSATVGNDIDCSAAVLGAGATASVTVFYSVDESQDPVTITNLVEATSDEVPTPTVASDTVELVEDVDLVVSKSFAADPVSAGSSGHSFTLSVANTGLSDAENVSLVDTVDPALVVSGISASPGVDCSATVGNDIDCSAAVLGAGATASVTVFYSVDESQDPVTITNLVEATSDEVPTPTGAADTVSIDQDIDLSITKTFTPDRVVAGSSGNEFTLSVNNSGSSVADNVTISDVVDAILIVSSVSISPAGDCTAGSGNAVSCSVGTLGPGGSVLVRVRYSVPSFVDATTITNTASVASDEVTTPVPASDTVEVVEDVNLVVTKRFLDQPVVAGSGGNRFQISVQNSGRSDARNVVVTDTVSPEVIVTGVTVAPAGDCTASTGNDVECLIASLSSGETVTVSVTFDVPAGAAAGTISNTAGATSAETPTPENGSASVDVMEDVDLSVVKTFVSDSVVAGSSGNQLTIEVANAGTSTADDVLVTDIVDTRLEVTSVSVAPAGDCSATAGNDVQCTILSLGPGASGVVTIIYDVPATIDSGTITNTATVSSSESPTPVEATDTVEVFEDVDLSLSKAFASDPVVAGGGGGSFTLDISNGGSSDAENVVVTDDVDAALVVTGVTMPSPGDCSASVGQRIECTLPRLDPGGTASISVTFAVPSTVAAGTVDNTAQVWSDEVATPATGSDSVAVVEDVVLEVTKNFADAVVVAGSTGNRFTIAVTNRGVSSAANVSIVDTVDPAFPVDTVSVGVAGDCAASAGQAIDCVIFELPAGASEVVTVTFDVDSAAASGTLTNTATVASDEAPTPVDDTAAVEVTRVADISVTKSGAPDPYIPGHPLIYTIDVLNDGPSTLTALELSESLPDELESPIYSVSDGVFDPSTGAWTGVQMASGDSVVLTVETLVPIDQTDPLINVVAVQPADGSADPDLSNNAASAETPSDLTSDVGVTKSITSTELIAGLGVEFVIEIHNDGPGVAYDAEVIDRLPTEVIDASWTCRAEGSVIAACGLEEGVGDVETSVTLYPGDVARITVSGRLAPDALGDLSNTVTVAVDDDVAAEDNTSTAVGDVQARADVAVAKTSGHAAATWSEVIVFDVTATNLGPSVARDVVVLDLLPPESTFVTASSEDGGQCIRVGDTVSCALGDLEVGDSVAVRVELLVADGAEGDLINRATVESTTVDPDERNNDDDAAVAISPASTNRPPILESDRDMVASIGGQPPPVVFADPDGDPWTLEVIGGDLPPGLTLGPDGSWSGSATDTGVFVFTVRACDPGGLCTVETLTVTIRELPRTGIDADRWALVALLMVVAGLGLIVSPLGRRDHRT